jgi:hypothetical protein
MKTNLKCLDLNIVTRVVEVLREDDIDDFSFVEIIVLDWRP